ncbi:MAG TPA: DNA-processing protein DprA [Candidatus Binatia bacterium]|nr:DNA-processing protein DprA [Candidatus Binatia bacterium]
MKVNSLKRDSPDFPEPLLQIDRAPQQIYYLGHNPRQWLDRPKLAVVGSRKASAYGLDVTDKLVTKLAAKGVVIISGLAYGIDAAAHRAALAAGGTTVAILPTSLDNIYPASHTNLSRQIIENGSLISEYSASDVVHKSNFTERNRIVSGLADAVLITEAAARSGTLSTARFALAQGKTVMAVPGNITSFGSQGCNTLIKSGALPVTEVSDVFFELGIKPSTAKNTPSFRGTEQEEIVLQLIASGTADQEELALKSGLDGQSISTILITLELGGHIKPAGGGQWLAN